jgi:uncharacterized BrkB/YihY/UPF0761 family membrane protein
VRGLVFTLTLVAGLVLVFAILCLIYWAVPNRPMRWSAIWRGATLATLAIGIVDYAFPFYLSRVSSFAKLGTTLVFILIVLLWFYAVAIIILGGATVNAMHLRRERPPVAGPAAS